MTVGQFRQFATATGHRTLAETDGKGGAHWARGKTQRSPEWTWCSPAFPQTEEHPAIHISWDDARAFCQWLSGQENRTYVLPAEDQWEFACRAGSSDAWCFGNDFSLLREYAWARTLKSTEPVGSKKANAFGLHDMHGNALEWCSDPWTPFRAEPERVSREHPADPNYFVQRGGCFVMNESTSRSGFRIGQPRTCNGSAEGFRVAIVGVSPPK